MVAYGSHSNAEDSLTYTSSCRTLGKWKEPRSLKIRSFIETKQAVRVEWYEPTRIYTLYVIEKSLPQSREILNQSQTVYSNMSKGGECGFKTSAIIWSISDKKLKRKDLSGSFNCDRQDDNLLTTTSRESQGSSVAKSVVLRMDDGAQRTVRATSGLQLRDVNGWELRESIETCDLKRSDASLVAKWPAAMRAAVARFHEAHEKVIAHRKVCNCESGSERLAELQADRDRIWNELVDDKWIRAYASVKR